VGLTDADHGELVSANSPRDHFFLAGRGIESPPSPLFHQWNREGPRFVTDDERFAGALVDPSPSLFKGDVEDLAGTAGSRRVGRVNQILPVGSEDRQQDVAALCLGGVIQRLRRFLRGLEYPLSRLSRGTLAA